MLDKLLDFFVGTSPTNKQDLTKRWLWTSFIAELASLIFALQHREIPFLLIDTGQHYESVLVNVRQEFNYRHLIGVYLSIRGDLIQRTADLSHKLKWLNNELRIARLREPAIPVVSGDTSTAAFMPIFWYLLSGLKSVHVEAGLRSSGPDTE